MVVLEWLFWGSLALIVYAHIGYPVLLMALDRVIGEAPPSARDRGLAHLPSVTLVIAAYDEEEVIVRKVENALALDYPPEKLWVTVASDGSVDRTVELAQQAGAHSVLDLPRGGKVQALNAAVRQADTDLVAFSDANSYWRPNAMRRLVERFADARVGYACGQVRFTGGEGGNQEGLYWRYEMGVREMESRLGGITAGNGGIYAVRRESYVELHPSRGQDIGFPFELTKRGWLAVYEPSAIAEERMAPTVEGEFKRKRRMMRGLWDVMLKWGMLDPRGYSPVYALEIYSHRLLRYLTPWLHVIALLANAALVGQGGFYVIAMLAQVGFLVSAVLGRFVPFLPLRIAYYYFTVTASIAMGLYDRIRAGGVPIGWEKVEGTR